MKSINQHFCARFEAKKSVFIAHLCPHAEFKARLNALKTEHPKARHFVWAVRFLGEMGQIAEDKSDDGEPRGTAGAPCLSVLRGAQLVDVGLVVVRYFGGVKLGTGGLVRAYTNASNAVVGICEPCLLKKALKFSLSLTLYNKIAHFCEKNSLKFERDFEKEFTNKNDFKSVNLRVFADENEEKILREFLAKLGVGLGG